MSTWTSPRRRTSALRTLGVTRAAVGVLSLLALDRGDWVAQLPAHAATAGRVLALRDLAQGTTLAVAPGERLGRLGSVVDGLHAASMVGLAVVAPGYRRVALVSGSFALAWIAWERRATHRPSSSWCSVAI